MYIDMYIYIHIYLHAYVHVYIYIWGDRTTNRQIDRYIYQSTCIRVEIAYVYVYIHVSEHRWMQNILCGWRCLGIEH